MPGSEGARRVVDLSHVTMIGNTGPYLDSPYHRYEGGTDLAGLDLATLVEHSGQLAAGIHVVEHLTNLESLPPQGARFTAAPPAVERFGTFPVRAFATM